MPAVHARSLFCSTPMRASSALISASASVGITPCSAETWRMPAMGPPNSPYSAAAAVSAGMKASMAKKVTPAARVETSCLSAVRAVRTAMSVQPAAGMAVGRARASWPRCRPGSRSRGAQRARKGWRRAASDCLWTELLDRASSPTRSSSRARCASCSSSARRRPQGRQESRGLAGSPRWKVATKLANGADRLRARSAAGGRAAPAAARRSCAWRTGASGARPRRVPPVSPSQWAIRRLRSARSWPGAPSRVAASIDRSHSVSKPAERLLRLAEPMRSSTSSMMVSLEWTMMVRPRVVTGL